ncbi:afadin- and alpha-actinin-binding protein-like isoform X2 [Syngnathoides biaculeatus]|uniref:afadin- and alpha-actinin-binding protein-like isoform X2 n=1 Tax=Syngnathoides biaculeatus TaxID=300417 RepID=UPI002ADD4556|nr:afadin- and alpha-actinin-binding protein-like isoform X2 [Syngnathoides biaculeatus]
MPESSSDVKDLCSSSGKCQTWPLTGHLDHSPLPLHTKSYMLTNFCTEHNVPECVTHINQEVFSLGLPPVWTQTDSTSDMNVVSVLNCMYELLQLHRRGIQTLEKMEMDQLKWSNNVDSLQLSCTQLKEQLELSKRENMGVVERERQLQLKVKTMQNCLKNEKEETHKLQNIVSSRASQYNHEMKRKERELNKLKERLNQLLVDKKDKRLAIDISNKLGRADGKRSLWKTEKTEAKHEGEMYKSLLRDYESRQGQLLLENAELRKVLKQMKKDMVAILSSKRSIVKGDKQDHSAMEVDSDEEEEVIYSCQESADLFIVHSQEKLTNSVRRQWRRLKNYVERLDNQDDIKDADAVPRETSKEMGKMRQEKKQCKDSIEKQQHLLQKVSTQCDKETSDTTADDSHLLQEKDRLLDEWKSLEDQRKSFERERKNFTEAAIRQSQERKTFEEDRAMWLKHQFLNLSPFADTKTPQRSKSQCSFQMLGETQPIRASLPEKPIVTSPTPGYRPSVSPSTPDLLHTLSLICENSSSKPKRNEDAGDASFLAAQQKWWISGDNHSGLMLTREDCGSI